MSSISIPLNKKCLCFFLLQYSEFLWKYIILDFRHATGPQSVQTNLSYADLDHRTPLVCDKDILFLPVKGIIKYTFIEYTYNIHKIHVNFTYLLI